MAGQDRRIAQGAVPFGGASRAGKGLRILYRILRAYLGIRANHLSGAHEAHGSVWAWAGGLTNAEGPRGPVILLRLSPPTADGEHPQGEAARAGRGFGGRRLWIRGGPGGGLSCAKACGRTETNPSTVWRRPSTALLQSLSIRRTPGARGVSLGRCQGPSGPESSAGVIADRPASFSGA